MLRVEPSMADNALGIRGNGSDKVVYLLKPRGFCAGVVRAIDIVELALKVYGPPIYVRKEIVHNRHVVTDLASRGAIFVDELDEVPEWRTRGFQRSRRGARGAGTKRSNDACA